MKTIFILFITIFFLSCSSQDSKLIRISTNAWIGYAPLFYAQEKGYLTKLNMKLINNVSLVEAAEVYAIGQAEMVTATQHEYFALQRTTKDITPVILIDRSYGGDMVLSNKSLEELQQAQKIYAYLEIDSINSEVLKEFMYLAHLDEDKMEFINKDQDKIQALQNDSSKAILITTYSPYDVKLKQKGFQELASTKDEQSLLVVDMLCAKKSLVANETKRLQKLKNIINKSIQEIQKDPKKTYLMIKSYLGNITYEEYQDALGRIQWINKPPQHLLNTLEKQHIHTRSLVL